MAKRKKAQVENQKLHDYLLSKKHLQGRSKAVWFEKAGYTKQNADPLRQELLQVFINGELVEKIETKEGIKFVSSV